MLHIEKLSLTDFTLYKDMSFDFVEGVTVVRGQNYSGKSLLFSPLKTLLFDEGSIPTGGKAILTGSKDGTPFDITAWAHGKSTRFSLAIDGKDQRTDTIAKSREVIDAFIGMPASLYSTTIGLTGLQPHPLASGKPASRLEWIHATLAFAEMYDAYNEKVDAHIKETKSKAIEHSIVVKELERLLAEEPRVPKKRPENTDSVAEQLSILQSRRDELSILVHKPNKPNKSREEVEKLLKKYSTELETLDVLAAEWKTYSRQLAAWNSQREAVRKTTDKLDRLCLLLKVPESLITNYGKLSSALSKQISNVNQTLDRADRTNKLYDSQRETRNILRSTPPTELSLKEATEKLKEVRDKLSYYKVSLSSIGDVCIFCNKDLSSSKKKANADVGKLREERDDLVATIEYHNAQAVDLVTRVDVEPLELKLRRMKELARLVNVLLETGTLSKPDKPSTELDDSRRGKIRSRIAKCKELLSEWSIYEKWESRVPDSLRKVENPTKEFNAVTEQLAELTSRVSDMSDKLIKYRTAVALRDQWEKNVEAVTLRVKELSKYPKRMKVLNLLKQAFGRDGLRAETLSSSLELFVANLNNLASILFTEPYKFEIDVGPRKCDVIAHRNKRSGSIFSLSGAEQRGWQLISALALLRILPSSSRCDTMILDELEANSSRATRERFIYDFLPELRRSVSKVVIVTPLSRDEFPVPCDREFAVVKKNAQSSLKER